MSGIILSATGSPAMALRPPPQRPRLILHAGTHKTGTTSIQQTLRQNFAYLRQNGFLYPDGSVPYEGSAQPHHEFAHSLTGTCATGLIDAAAFVAVARRSLEPGETLLLSAEPLYRHQHGRAADDFTIVPETYWASRRRYLEGVRRTLAGFDIEVLLYFRSPDRFAESWYWYCVREMGVMDSFAAFVERFEPWFDYHQQLATFREVFPAVRVESYEKACEAPGGLVAHFFRSIGCPLPPHLQEPRERQGQYGGDVFGSAVARADFLARHPPVMPL